MDDPAKREHAEAIKPVLEKAQSELAEHLREACEVESKDLSQESSEELLRLEDELLAAVKSVEQTLTIRRVMDHSAQVRQESRPDSASGPERDIGSECLVREFADRSGRPWRIWRVIPGRAHARGDRDRVLGAYASGWLAFEALDDGTRRRLLEPSDDWMTVSEADLTRMLERATVVPHRLAARERASDETPPAGPQEAAR